MDINKLTPSGKLNKKHLLTLSNYTEEEIFEILLRARSLEQKKSAGEKKTDLKNIPDEVRNSKVAFVAAGYDHIIAITESGRVIGWGEYEGAQYGDKGSLIGTSQVIAMPDILLNGTINVNDVAQLTCGYQVSAIVMKNGSVYVWGNYKSGATNMKTLRARTDVAEIQFLGTKCVALLKDGSVWFGNAEESLGIVEIAAADGSLTFKKLSEYQNGRKAVQIAATKISAGVSTGIGSHVEEIEEKGDDQFEISDGRSVDEVYQALLDHEMQPVMSDYIYV